mmetsp:Transcript_40865/g.73822  ORF Transcript_40865/g.73822 Transcript_40865/m.73822 type:complete len:204 (-) Transcript_40865:225-836(-)
MRGTGARHSPLPQHAAASSGCARGPCCSFMVSWAALCSWVALTAGLCVQLGYWACQPKFLAPLLRNILFRFHLAWGFFSYFDHVEKLKRRLIRTLHCALGVICILKILHYPLMQDILEGCGIGSPTLLHTQGLRGALFRLLLSSRRLSPCFKPITTFLHFDLALEDPILHCDIVLDVLLHGPKIQDTLIVKWSVLAGDSAHSK